MEFYQVYDPLGNIWLSALVALSPIALFFISLIVFKLKGYSAGFLSLVLSIIIALFVYKMPAQMVSASFFLWLSLWLVADRMDCDRCDFSLQPFSEIWVF